MRVRVVLVRNLPDIHGKEKVYGSIP